MNASFKATWDRICELQGVEFQTITGLRFTYSVAGNAVRPDRTNQNIARSDFEKIAPIICSLRGPGEIANVVRGSAYLWAILKDTRVAGEADE